MGGTTETSSTQSMSAPQEANVFRGLGDLNSLYGQGGLGYHGAGALGPGRIMQGAMGQAGMTGNPYLNQIQQFGLGQLGRDDVNMQGAEGAANQMMGGLGLGMSGLGRTAAGGFLNSNPYLDRAMQGAVDPMLRAYENQIAPGIDAMFGSAGRGGSGMHRQATIEGGRALQDSVGDATTRMAMQNFQSERDRMMAAQQGLAGLAGQGIGALGGIQGLNQQSQNMGLGALQGLFGMQNQNLQNRFQAGQLEDQFGMRGRQDQIDQFNSQRDAIAQLMALSGTMGMYGGNQTTSETYNPGAMDFINMGLGAAGMVGGAFF